MSRIKPALVVAGACAASLGVAALLFWPSDSVQMVTVPAGPATLGYVYYTGLYGPMPYEVSAFHIDRFEVTNAEYAAFVAATGHAPAAFSDDDEFNQPGQPVTGVLHADAMAFCGWAGKRLPTEIEWEKAARGTDGQIFPWGNDENLSRIHISGKAPVAVNEFPGDISPFGVRGMAGNVSEWVSDTRTAKGGRCLDGAIDMREQTPEMMRILAELKALNGGVLPEACLPPAVDPNPHIAGEPCAYIKGNNWNGRPHMSAASNRLWDYTNTYAEFVGFRCAIDG